MDTTDKKHLVTLVPPLIKVDFQTGDISLDLNSAISKILLTKNKPLVDLNFIDKKISAKRAIAILAKNGI